MLKFQPLAITLALLLLLLTHQALGASARLDEDGPSPFLASSTKAEAPSHLPKEAVAEAIFDNCFLAGTLVAMADGSMKPIEQVRAGDQVKACDPASGQVVDREVVRTFRNVSETIVNVTWAPLDRIECLPIGQRGRGERHSVGSSRGGDGEDGEDGEPPSADGAQTVRCTPGHPWWVESQLRWRFAGDLRVGDLLRLDAGRVGVVLALEVRQEVARTFNFEVEREHTYFVAQHENAPSVLVHNSSARLLAAAKRVRAGRQIVMGGELPRSGGKFVRRGRPLWSPFSTRGGSWTRADTAFEAAVVERARFNFQHVSAQISIRPLSASGRLADPKFRIDALARDGGAFFLIDAKGGLGRWTKGQKFGIPAVLERGGRVVGTGSPLFSPGTTLSAGRVHVVPVTPKNVLDVLPRGGP